MWRDDDEDEEELVEVEGGNLQEVLDKLGPSSTLLPSLHNLIPTLQDKVAPHSSLRDKVSSHSNVPTRRGKLSPHSTNPASGTSYPFTP